MAYTQAANKGTIHFVSGGLRSFTFPCKQTYGFDIIMPKHIWQFLMCSIVLVVKRMAVARPVKKPYELIGFRMTMFRNHVHSECFEHNVEDKYE